MSYDVSLMINTGGHEAIEVYWRNHTSNTATMWREAGCDIAAFDGERAAVLAETLFTAIADIEARPDHYVQWNPPNKWGSVETCLDFLRDLLTACDKYPATTVSVSR